jgi:hypothetical protein
MYTFFNVEKLTVKKDLAIAVLLPVSMASHIPVSPVMKKGLDN